MTKLSDKPCYLLNADWVIVVDLVSFRQGGYYRHEVEILKYFILRKYFSFSGTEFNLVSARSLNYLVTYH